MRVAVAGFGAWGRLHAEAVIDIGGATLAGFYCHGDDSAELARTAHPTVPMFRDYPALLDAGIDVVCIAVPNHLHADFAVRALQAGCHVFLEKPLGITAAQCDAVCEAAACAGRHVAVDHELRVSHQWGRVRGMIAGGEIGRVIHQHFSLFRQPFRSGSAGWRREPGQVGSWMLEELVHFVDLVLWYARENGQPARLTAYGTGSGGGLTDTVSALLAWADGSTALVTQCLAGFQHHTLLEITADAGAIRTWWSATFDRSATPEHSLVIRRGNAEPTAINIPHSGEIFELRENIAQSLASFRSGTPPAMPLADAEAAVIICLAIERSLVTGAPVELGAW